VRESRWGSPWLALVALLAGAGAIRLVGIEYGLPFPLLNPDEADVVPRAWRMTHGGGLDPGWFDYPTLLIYVLAPFQHWADEPRYYLGFVLLAPLVVVGSGQWQRLAVAAALAPPAFLAATPYFAVHLGAALDDVLRVQRGVRRGWLGFESDPWAPTAFLDRLWEGIGPALLVALGGLVLALVYRTLADRVLAAFVLAYFLTLMPLDAHFNRTSCRSFRRWARWPAVSERWPR
jgi:hypothetical protein